MARKKVAVDAARASYCPSDIIELKIKKLKERMVRLRSLSITYSFSLHLLHTKSCLPATSRVICSNAL